MKKLALVLFGALLSLSAYPAYPSPESVDTLMLAMKIDRSGDMLFESMELSIKPQLDKLAGGKNLTPERRSALEASLKRTMTIMREELSWAKMQPIYRQIYQESFTQEEIDGLLVFYKSPAGAAFVDKMPVVMQKTMTIMQSNMGPMMERLKAAAAEAKLQK